MNISKDCVDYMKTYFKYLSIASLNVMAKELMDHDTNPRFYVDEDYYTDPDKDYKLRFSISMKDDNRNIEIEFINPDNENYIRKFDYEEFSECLELYIKGREKFRDRIINKYPVLRKISIMELQYIDKHFLETFIVEDYNIVTVPGILHNMSLDVKYDDDFMSIMYVRFDNYMPLFQISHINKYDIVSYMSLIDILYGKYDNIEKDNVLANQVKLLQYLLSFDYDTVKNIYSIISKDQNIKYTISNSNEFNIRFSISDNKYRISLRNNNIEYSNIVLSEKDISFIFHVCMDKDYSDLKDLFCLLLKIKKTYQNEICMNKDQIFSKFEEIRDIISDNYRKEYYIIANTICLSMLDDNKDNVKRSFKIYADILDNHYILFSSTMYIDDINIVFDWISATLE